MKKPTKKQRKRRSANEISAYTSVSKIFYDNEKECLKHIPVLSPFLDEELWENYRNSLKDPGSK